MSLASNCFETSDIDTPKNNLTKLQALSLDDKILYSTVKIKEFYIAMKGQVYVSFSGGKDSTVLLDLVRRVYPDVPAVFVDTGLEYPEIREHVKTVENVTWLRPEKTFKQVIMDEGYPVFGKEIAKYIDLAQRGNEIAIERFTRNSTEHGLKRYQYMIDAPFKVGSGCCSVLKKKPIAKYSKETGRYGIIGTRAGESMLRIQDYVRNGDNRIEGDKPISKPLSIWNEKDIWNYIHRFDLPYASIYDKGESRTGCIFCMFGIMFDPTKFLRLKKTHPQLWDYCMKPKDKGGLGMKEVLDYIHIPTGCGQTNLIEFTEEVENE